MFITLIVLAAIITLAQIVYVVRCNKEQAAHTEAMRTIWEERKARRAALPKAIVSRNSPYFPKNA